MDTRTLGRASLRLNSVHDVVYGEGQFTAVGELGTVVASPAGRIRTTRASSTRDDLISLARENGLFATVTTSAEHTRSLILTSADDAGAVGNGPRRFYRARAG